VEQHKDGEWDEVRHEEINLDDKFLDAEINDKADNEYFGIDESVVDDELPPTADGKPILSSLPPLNPELEKPERVLNCNDNDSVATVNTAANQVLITGQINETIVEKPRQQLVPITPIGSVQGSTVTSDITMSTRVTDMESSLSDIKRLLTLLLPPSLTPGTHSMGPGAPP
jgi:hypothetical protein